MTFIQWLARRLPMPHVSLHARLFAVIGVLLSLYAGANAIASLGDEMLAAPTLNDARVSAELPLPSVDEQIAQPASPAWQFVNEYEPRTGDSAGSILQGLRIDDDRTLAFIRSDPVAHRLLQVRPGRTIVARTDANGVLLWLQFPDPAAGPGPSADSDSAAAPVSHMVLIERAGDALRASAQAVAVERRVEMRSGTITSSLFAATDLAGIPDAVTRQIADIFDSDIDFHIDLRKGDTFRVIYETFHVNGEYQRAGRVLAAEFVNAGVVHQAAWFEPSPGSDGYYSADGRNVHKAFLRSPIEFSRVSSGFSGNRLHPIHLRWQKHTGVDYAAPAGTPIRSVADGTIDFVGWKNGYGNVVIVRHSGIYETLYAHMSRFGTGIKRGVHIAQGQIVGQVGMTGWATGPHLHYEFHVAGQPRDPLKVALPAAAPIAPAMLAAFATRQGDLFRQLALLRPTQLALR